MVMKFLDAQKTIATCIAESCDECAVREKLNCHFSFNQLLHFLVLVSPSFLLGGAGVYHVDGWWLVPWFIIIAGYFGFVEIRVMCSHCPHYAEDGGSLRCWANYGAPKLWRYRPGPMASWGKVVFFAGFALVWGFPLFFLVLGLQVFLLIVYLLSVAGFFLTLSMFLCSRCMNFACPLNRVEDETREKFFERNPGVAEAWKHETMQP